MKLVVCAIYDKLTGYMVPGFQQNDEQSIRAFAYDINSSEMSLINANPEDFNLQKIGTYDTETGLLEACPITILADAGQLLRKRGE